MAGIYLAYQAGAFSYFAYLRNVSPAAAIALKPGDGLALVKNSDEDIQRRPNREFKKSEAAAAALSLVARPLNAGALRLLGSYSETQGNVSGSSAAMLLADRVSRRDMLSQLWLIERSVSNDDVIDAIRHYHAALSVHPELGGTLFPVLSKALSFGEVRNALRPYIISEASWMPAFMAAASTQAEVRDLDAFATPAAWRLADERYQAATATIIHRLASAGKVQSALNLAAKIAPGIRQQDMADFGFTDATRDPRLGRLSWTLSQADGVNSSIDGNGGLTVALTPPFSGEIATRDVVVEPGRRYQLSHRVEYESDGARPQVRWSAACVHDALVNPIWEQNLPTTTGTSTQNLSISVPDNCALIRFQLSAIAPDAQIISSFTVNNMSLK